MVHAYIDLIVCDVTIHKFIHDVIVFKLLSFNPRRGDRLLSNFKGSPAHLAVVAMVAVVAMHSAATPSVLVPRRAVVGHLVAHVTAAGCYGGEDEGAREQPLLAALDDEGGAPLIESEL